jgi:hypothetical protein
MSFMRIENWRIQKLSSLDYDANGMGDEDEDDDDEAEDDSDDDSEELL